MDQRADTGCRLTAAGAAGSMLCRAPRRPRPKCRRRRQPVEIEARRIFEFRRWADRCPSRDDGWGEFALALVPIAAAAIRTRVRLFRSISLIPCWESQPADPEEKRGPASGINTSATTNPANSP